MPSSIDVLLFTATNVECLALYRALGDAQEFLDHPGGRAGLCEVDGRTILVAASGVGKGRMNKAFQSLAPVYKPRLFINFGAAGAVNPRIPIGAPCLPREIIGYVWPELEQRGEPIHCAVEKYLELHPALRMVRAGSCAHDIRHPEIRDRIREQHQIDITDWETHRLAEACRLQKLPFLALRCVTDHADHRAGIDFSRNAASVLERGARLLPPILSRFFDTD